MKITFLRHGHSNNSSSSHSLIFTRQELPPSNESAEFGWEFFTCSSKQDKQNYLLACLYEKFVSRLNFPYLYQIKDEDKNWNASVESAEKELKNLENKLFQEWVETHLLLSPCKNREEEYHPFGYVDHQSKICFPYDRSGKKINHEFAKEFIEEFVNNNWYVFGGNDNVDDSHPAPTNNEISDHEDFRAVWRFLTDTGDVMCVKDSLTNEYVLSNMGGQNYNGSIIKIKF